MKNCYFKTTDLVPGDMVVFWDVFGIYLGLENNATDLNVEVRSNLNDQSDTAKAYQVFVEFKQDGKSMCSCLSMGSLIFLPETPSSRKNFEPADIVLLKILIDGTVKILPRIENPYFLYDDKLRRVEHQEQREVISP